MSNHSLPEFELELIKLEAEIKEFRQPNGYVSEVIGKINDVQYKWNCFGHCFRGNVPVPKFDLNLINGTIFSADQKTITRGTEVHKFKRTFFNLGKGCSKCSLLKPCCAVKETDFPFPCHSDVRNDKHNGFFVRKS
jgi:hypothetical protein